MASAPRESEFDFTSHCEPCVTAIADGDKFCVYHWGYVNGFIQGWTERDSDN